ncbi:MAG: hypothetical protein ABI461_11830 [Polyangiaceae bacterium]
MICRKPISMQDAEDEQRQSFPVSPPDARATEDKGAPPPLPGTNRNAQLRLHDIEDEEDEDLVGEWLNADHQLSAEIFEPSVAYDRVAKPTLLDGPRARAHRLHEKWAMGAFLVAIGLVTAGAALAGARGNRASEAQAITTRTALVSVRISAVPAPSEHASSTPPPVNGRGVDTHTGPSN